MTELAGAAAEQIVRGIDIPPRPAVVMAVMAERERDDPDLPGLARLIAADVALSAAVIKTVNSPLYGLRRRLASVEQAVQMLGLKSLANLVSGLALRGLLDAGHLERFWDEAARTALLAAHLAPRADVDRDDAHLFGLFRDAGIPLMLRRFPDQYRDTLRLANQDATRSFTQVEEGRHGVHHAVVGYYLARGWGLPEPLRQAILRHHEAEVFQDPHFEPAALRLIALGHLAGYLENRVNRPLPDLEWVKHGAASIAYLMIDSDDLPEMEYEARTLFMESGL